MLVTLSLSTVVVSFAYMAYNYIFSSYNQYEKMNTEISEFTNCHVQLQKLMNISDYIEAKENQLIFHLKNKENINVQLTEKFIVFSAENTTIDTAKCTVINHIFSFGTENVTNGYIDKISIETEMNKTAYHLFFEKLYDAEKMVRLDSLNKFAK